MDGAHPNTNDNGAQSENGDDQMRHACDSCTRSKIKCPGGNPCPRCSRRKTECIYSEKRRCGPKRKKRSLEEGADAAAASGHNSGNMPLTLQLLNNQQQQLLQQQRAASSRTLTTTDHQHLRVFLQHVNTFLPLTDAATLRDAMNPLSETAVVPVGSGATAEAETHRLHARKAVLWGSVAVGALFVDNEAAADAACRQARAELKECFDASSPELMSAYLIMTLYWLHHLDGPKLQRYAGFAQQTFRELLSRDAAVPPDLSAALQFLSVMLRVAGITDAVGCRVEDPPRLSSSCSAKAGVLRIMSAVLLRLFYAYDPAAGDPHAPPVSERGGWWSRSGGGGNGGLQRSNSSNGNGSNVPYDDVGVEKAKPRRHTLLCDAIGSITAGLLGRSQNGGPRFEVDDSALLDYLEHAERLLAQDDRQGDMLPLVVKGFKGFFLLRSGQENLALSVAEPLADLVSDSPVVLHFPMTWIVARSVLAILKRCDRRIAAERMTMAMAPYFDRFPFALKCCTVGALVLETYTNGKDAGDVTAATVAAAGNAKGASGRLPLPVGWAELPHPLGEEFLRWPARVPSPLLNGVSLGGLNGTSGVGGSMNGSLGMALGAGLSLGSFGVGSSSAAILGGGGGSSIVLFDGMQGMAADTSPLQQAGLPLPEDSLAPDLAGSFDLDLGDGGGSSGGGGSGSNRPSPAASAVAAAAGGGGGGGGRGQGVVEDDRSVGSRAADNSNLINATLLSEKRMRLSHIVRASGSSSGSISGGGGGGGNSDAFDPAVLSGVSLWGDSCGRGGSNGNIGLGSSCGLQLQQGIGRSEHTVVFASKDLVFEL